MAEAMGPGNWRDLLVSLFYNMYADGSLRSKSPQKELHFSFSLMSQRKIGNISQLFLLLDIPLYPTSCFPSPHCYNLNLAICSVLISTSTAGFPSLLPISSMCQNLEFWVVPAGHIELHKQHGKLFRAFSRYQGGNMKSRRYGPTALRDFTGNTRGWLIKILCVTTLYGKMPWA